MTNEQSSELAEPSVGSFDDPAAFVAAQLAAIFIAPVPAVASVRHDQLDAAFLQPLAQWVRVVGAVSDHPFRLCLGRPLALGTRTSASVASASVASPGEALSSRTPSGRPWPSTSTIHFVPLPRLVFPTAEPLFSPERNCRPERSPPTSAALRRRAPQAAPATRRAIRPSLPTASDDASRWPGTGIYLAETATLLLFAAPRESPPDTPGLRPMDGRDYPSASSALATAVRLTPTAYRSTE